MWVVVAIVLGTLVMMAAVAWRADKTLPASELLQNIKSSKPDIGRRWALIQIPTMYCLVTVVMSVIIASHGGMRDVVEAWSFVGGLVSVASLLVQQEYLFFVRRIMRNLKP